jgi:excisionase family DNA binding protein
VRVLLAHPDEAALEVVARVLPGAAIRRTAGLRDSLAVLVEPLDLVVVAETLSDAAGVELAEEMRDRGILATIVLLPEGPVEEALGRAFGLGIAGGGQGLADPDTALDSRQAAAYLTLNARSVRLMARTGEIPAFHAGRRWYFRKSDLDAWIQATVTGQDEF